MNIYHIKYKQHWITVTCMPMWQQTKIFPGQIVVNNITWQLEISWYILQSSVARLWLHLITFSSHPWTMDAVTCSGHREVLLTVDFPQRITTWNPNIFQFISFLLTWRLWFIHTVLPFFFSLACQCRLLDAWIQVTWHGMVIIQCNCRYIGKSQKQFGRCECNRYLANLWCVLLQPLSCQGQVTTSWGWGHLQSYTVQSVQSSFTLLLWICRNFLPAHAATPPSVLSSCPLYNQWSPRCQLPASGHW